MQGMERLRVQELDQADSLREYPSQFVVGDTDVCYLDGNSLGLLDKRMGRESR
jgi:kynureninase